MSLGLQPMPFLAWTMLIMMAVGEAMDVVPPAWLITGLTLAAILAGPAATFWLIVRMATGRWEQP